MITCNQSYLELFSEFFFLLLELVDCLLIPAPGLGLQVTGTSRDDSRLLEQSSIEGYRLDTEREERSDGKIATKKSPC